MRSIHCATSDAKLRAVQGHPQVTAVAEGHQEVYVKSQLCKCWTLQDDVIVAISFFPVIT